MAQVTLDVLFRIVTELGARRQQTVRQLELPVLQSLRVNEPTGELKSFDKNKQFKRAY